MRTARWKDGGIRIQVKATDFLRPRQNGQSFAFRLETADLRLWLRERPPVILIVYDALREDAYWLYVPGLLPASAAVRRFASFRDAVDDQTAGVSHDADIV